MESIIKASRKYVRTSFSVRVRQTVTA